MWRGGQLCAHPARTLRAPARTLPARCTPKARPSHAQGTPKACAARAGLPPATGVAANPNQVWQLARAVDDLQLPVMAYGLRVDFQGELFAGVGQGQGQGQGQG